MILVKSHGLGNDYLVLATPDPGEPVPGPDRVRRLCDRHRGVGSDGLLVPLPSAVADVGVRIFNPDGSEAEKSGNGLRILARFLVDHRGFPPTFTVEVGGAVVRCRVDPDAVTVDMGNATFLAAEVPLALEVEEAVEIPHPLDDRLRCTVVALGNPHCVFFFDGPLDALPWRTWGAAVERHPVHPRRTNVQFARVLDRDLVEARIWERGAGETLASGSSACAVAAAGVRTGRLDPRVTVRMPGGDLHVEVGPGWSLRLRGPVEEVGEFRVAPGWRGEGGVRERG